MGLLLVRSRILLLAAFSAGVAGVTRAETFRFTGTTTVDMAVAKDALKQVQLVGLGKFDCGVIEGVEAEILPDNYRPDMNHEFVQGAKEVHERWIVSLCGRREPFLIGFWAAPQGGTMFHVAHPFPADANAKAKR